MSIRDSKILKKLSGIGFFGNLIQWNVMLLKKYKILTVYL